MTRVLKIESKMRAPSVLSRNSEICRTKRVNGTKVSSHLRLQHNRSLKAFAFDYVELQIYRETPLVQRDIKGSKNCLPLECSRRPKRHRLTLSWPCPHTSTVEARGHKGEMRRRRRRGGRAPGGAAARVPCNILSEQTPRPSSTRSRVPKLAQAIYR
jgi:hypothetical protein